MSSELEELKKRVAELEKAAKPPEPFVPEPWQRRDPTEGMSMPKSAMLEMINAIPESVMQGIRADARKPNPVTTGSSQIKSTPSALSQPQRKGGWIEPRPLEPPPGVAIADRLVDAQDEIDRGELALKLAKARMGKGEMK